MEEDIDPVLKERKFAVCFKVSALTALKCIADGACVVKRATRWRCESPRAAAFATRILDITRGAEIFPGDTFKDFAHRLLWIKN
ncbi:MAG: hypothetical protein ACI9ZV_000425 [Candidatus Azotimanducaceae bacterium]|jgi:hypothetical protein